MNYELKSSIRKSKVSLPIKALLGIVILIALLYIFFPKFLPTVFSYVAMPFWGVDRSKQLGAVTLPSHFENSAVAELQKENQELKRILNARVASSSVSAFIIKKPPFTAYDMFIVDAGSVEGVSEGDYAYVIGGVPIGEIAEVQAHMSKVKLYSSYGEKFDVLIGTSSIQGTATGRGGGAFEVSFPRDTKIREGDTVMIPHISSLPFGIVQKIVADPVKTFSTVIFSQPINIYQQKWVEIVPRDGDFLP